MQPETGAARGSCQKRVSEISILKEFSSAISSDVEWSASISGLSLTFWEGKIVLRIVMESCSGWALPSRTSISEEGPGVSLTAMGNRPKRLPSGCKNSLAVRPLKETAVKSGGQMMRKVSPRFIAWGVTLQS